MVSVDVKHHVYLVYAHNTLGYSYKLGRRLAKHVPIIIIRERERDTERDRDRETETETDRQTDRQRQTCRDRERN